MEPRDDRAWGRIQHGLLMGFAVGAAIGAFLGLLMGAIVFQRAGTIAAAALAGVIGIGGLGAFWGVLAGLESPDPPGEEPGNVDHPVIDIPELTHEERGRRFPPSP
jgi:hypothetical protein